MMVATWASNPRRSRRGLRDSADVGTAGLVVTIAAAGAAMAVAGLELPGASASGARRMRG
jgi:hypothetical protein